MEERIIGVNSFCDPHAGGVSRQIELIGSSEEDKQSQLHLHFVAMNPLVNRLRRHR